MKIDDPAFAVLGNFQPCREALVWMDGKSVRECWQTCEIGEWMMWALDKSGYDRKKLLLLACRLAKRALKYVPKGENRPRLAIEAAEGWVEGRVTAAAMHGASLAAVRVAIIYYDTDSSAYEASLAAAFSANPDTGELFAFLRAAVFYCDNDPSACEASLAARRAAFFAKTVFIATARAAVGAFTADSIARGKAEQKTQSNIIRRTVKIKDIEALLKSIETPLGLGEGSDLTQRRGGAKGGLP